MNGDGGASIRRQVFGTGRPGNRVVLAAAGCWGQSTAPLSSSGTSSGGAKSSNGSGQCESVLSSIDDIFKLSNLGRTTAVSDGWCPQRLGPIVRTGSRRCRSQPARRYSPSVFRQTVRVAERAPLSPPRRRTYSRLHAGTCHFDVCRRWRTIRARAHGKSLSTHHSCRWSRP